MAQSFAVAVAADALWRELHDLEMVARCMPGVALDGTPEDGRVRGTLGLKLGPITTSFAGTAEVMMDDATHTGVVRGQALDRKNNSRARSEIRFSVTAERAPHPRPLTGSSSRVPGTPLRAALWEPADGSPGHRERGEEAERAGASKVAITVDFTLSGRLAQFSR
ncbi:MAG: SRPBCC domain-containing protein, partial [Acetobacteraceae bacterium]